MLGPLAAILLGTASFGAMSNENAGENANKGGNSLSALYEMLSPGGTKKPPP